MTPQKLSSGKTQARKDQNHNLVRTDIGEPMQEFVYEQPHGFTDS